MDKSEQIISALADLSRTRGFYRVTVDELAAQAGVSKRTIYRYFRSKDEIVEALMEKFMNTMAGEFDRIMESGEKPIDMLTGIVQFAHKARRSLINPLVMEDIRRYYPGVWDKLERFRAKKIQENFDKFLIDKNDGRYVGKVNPRILSAAFLASVQAVVNPDFILDHGLTFEETVKQVVELFMFGIFAEGDSRARE